VAAQLAKQLLKIRQRNLLALADGSQSYRAAVLSQAQINHRSDRKAAFGREAHNKLLKVSLAVVKQQWLLLKMMFQKRFTPPATHGSRTAHGIFCCYPFVPD
jgi:hypothetical protein